MTTTPVLDVQQLGFHYGAQPVLENVSFQIFPQDFVAIIGPNGGGKTTLIKLIMGLLTPSSGSISLLGGTPEHTRTQVGYLSQSTEWESDFPISVLDIVLMSTLRFHTLYRPKTTDKQQALDTLESVGIRHLANRQIQALSGGEKQRVLLARSLMNSPRFLILDEPTASVDPGAETSVYELLKELNSKMPILMVSHDLSAVAQMVNKIGCLNRSLVFHHSSELHTHELESAYGCPIDLIAHGVPHRILKSHD